MKIKNSQILKRSENRDSGLRFDRPIFGPYDLHMWCYSNEYITVKMTLQTKLRLLIGSL